MSYRPARPPEFIEAHGDLTALKTWRRRVWFARALYGSDAARIVITAEWRDVVPGEGEETDQQYIVAHITEVAVYDQRGRLLPPDLRLPHWQERITQPDLAQLAGAAREAAITEVLRAAHTQLGALYLPTYPNLRIDVSIGARYRPDLVRLGLDGRPVFWGECGEVGLEKLRVLCARYRETHLVFAKWAINIAPFAALIEQALRDARRTAPVELIGFDGEAARFVDQIGGSEIGFADVIRRQWLSNVT
jgi:hypothetical protein